MAYAILACIAAVIVLPIVASVIIMTFGIVQLILMYVVLPYLLFAFGWDLVSQPTKSFANLHRRWLNWRTHKDDVVTSMRASWLARLWRRRSAVEATAQPVSEEKGAASSEGSTPA